MRPRDGPAATWKTGSPSTGLGPRTDVLAARTQPPSAATATKRGEHLQATPEPIQAQDLPALLRGDPPQVLIGVDDHRMTHGAQHRQIRLGVRVGVGGSQVDPLALGQLAHREHLALAVVERSRGAPGVAAFDAPPSASRDHRRRRAHAPAGRPSPARRPSRCTPACPHPGARRRARASADTAAAAPRRARAGTGAAGRARAHRRSSPPRACAPDRRDRRSSRAAGSAGSHTRRAPSRRREIMPVS